MKLAFISDNGFSEKNNSYFYSGANVQHYETMISHFTEIHFVARNSVYDGTGGQISTRHKVYLTNSIFDISLNMKNIIDLYKTIKKVVIECDAVICFGINGYIAHKIAKKYNKPIISYVGGCIYDTLMNMDSFLKKMVAPIFKNMVKEMTINADYVHYVDSYLTNKYPTKGLELICPSSRIVVNPNSLENRLKKVENNKKEETLIGLIGYTHNKIKGIDVAIRSLTMLDENCRLEIVGRGDTTWLKELSVSLGVENRVKFLGVLNGREAVFNWLEEIDIYIQPSLTEGMPRATIEAMSMGCPVVSTSVGGLKNLIDEDFRVECSNAKDLANKINKISGSKKVKYQQIIKNFEMSKKFDVNNLDKKRDIFYGKIVSDLNNLKRKTEKNR